jgi:hypothetical protein
MTKVKTRKCEEEETPKEPEVPSYANKIQELIMSRIGGEPEGLFRCDVRRCYREFEVKESAWKRAEWERHTICSHSFFLSFSSGGELIQSYPPLPEIGS